MCHPSTREFFTWQLSCLFYRYGSLSYVYPSYYVGMFLSLPLLLSLFYYNLLVCLKFKSGGVYFYLEVRWYHIKLTTYKLEE